MVWWLVIGVVLWCIASPFAFGFAFMRYHDTTRWKFPWWDNFILGPIINILMFPSLIVVGIYTLYRKFVKND